MNVHPHSPPALNQRRGTRPFAAWCIGTCCVAAWCLSAAGCGGKRFTAAIRDVDASVSPSSGSTGTTAESETAQSDGFQASGALSLPTHTKDGGDPATGPNNGSADSTLDPSDAGLTNDFTPSQDASFTSTDTAIDASVTDTTTKEAPTSGTDTSGDNGTTGFDPNCNVGAFEMPREVQGLGFSNNLWGPSISGDGQYLYFGHTAGDEDLFVAQRAGDAASFLPSEPLVTLNTSSSEGTPFVTADGLSLYFYATRPGGPGDRDLWHATRSAAADAFEDPSLVAGANAERYDHLPWLSLDELTLVYTSLRDDGVGQSDIWMATRPSKDVPFINHALLPGINTEAREDAVAFSPDGLTVLFSTDRESGGDLDIWQATRSSVEQEFGNAMALPTLNSVAEDTNLTLTSDGRHLYFSSGRSGEQRIWVASRECILP